MSVDVRLTPATDRIADGRRKRLRRRSIVMTVLAVLIGVVFVVSLMVGNTFYGLGDVLAVAFGQDVAGATFTVGRLRLPRAALAVIVGMSFGLAGVTFQTMLRNPLASPDIIGISAGSGAAAAFAIVMLGLSGPAVSLFAIVAGLGVALLVYGLAFRRGGAGTRLILIGIGLAAMLDSATQYVLSQAGQWDLQEATRWLTGSLNGATWDQAWPAGLIAFATAATGPVAFVAFLSGPIAARIVGPHGSMLVPSALVGALLVLVGDFVGQHLLGLRYPVGIVTGVLGAPYLVYLIVRTNRAGGSL
ncbi:MAG: fepG2 [Microbacterium sp.]|nr:fepG2 [Microbacterium sp.]